MPIKWLMLLISGIARIVSHVGHGVIVHGLKAEIRNVTAHPSTASARGLGGAAARLVPSSPYQM